MDIKITVCSLSLGIASFIGIVVPAFIALNILPARFYGLGHVGLAIAMSLYTRQQLCRFVARREEIAYQLGQASNRERVSLSGLPSLVD